MSNRNKVFRDMDKVRSVLERLPEKACRSLRVYFGPAPECRPEIMFTCGTFADVLQAFPFTQPIRGSHDEEYDYEEFFVDGVRLFHLIRLIETDDPGTLPEGHSHEDGAC